MPATSDVLLEADEPVPERARRARAGREPAWWEEAPAEEEAAEEAAWWHAATPDEPGPPAAPPPPGRNPFRLESSNRDPRCRAAETEATAEAGGDRSRADDHPATKEETRLAGTPHTPHRIVVVGLVAAGTYFGFLRDKPTTPAGDNKDQSKGTIPQPRPPVVHEPKEDELLPDPPAPKDFTEKLRPKLFNGHEGGVAAISTAKSGQRFVSVGFDQTVRLWTVGRGEPTRDTS